MRKYLVLQLLIVSPFSLSAMQDQRNTEFFKKLNSDSEQNYNSWKSFVTNDCSSESQLAEQEKINVGLKLLNDLWDGTRRGDLQSALYLIDLEKAIKGKNITDLDSCKKFKDILNSKGFLYSDINDILKLKFEELKKINYDL